MPTEEPKTTKTSRSRGRPKEKEVASGADRKCRTCEDAIVRRLQLRKMITSCELKLIAERKWQYVQSFLENMEDMMKNLESWGRRELNKLKSCSNLGDVFGLDSASESFSGKQIFSDLFDKMEILKIHCSWLKNEAMKLEKHIPQAVASLGASQLIAPTAIEVLLWKLVCLVRWPTRLDRYLSETDLLKAQTGRIITDQDNISFATSSPNFRNVKDSLGSPKPSDDQSSSITNAPVKKGRRPKQLKLELARSSAATPAKRRPLPRMKDIDPDFVQEFEKLLSIGPQNGFDNINNNKLKDLLKQLLTLVKNDPPVLLYRELCHALAILALEEETVNDVKAASYFCEAMSVSMRHAILLNVGKKLRSVDSASEGDSSPPSAAMEAMRKIADFRGPKDWSLLVDSLPEEWTICQLNLVSLPGQDRNQLFATRLQKNRPPLVVPFPRMTDSERRHLLEKWEWFMKENHNSLAIKLKKDWWQQRSKLDEDMREWMEELEKTWFSGFVGALLGRFLNEEDEKNSKRAVDAFLRGCPVVSDKKRRMVELLLSGSHLLDKRGMIQALSFLAEPDADRDQLKHFIPLVQSISKKFNFEIASRGPVILILDKDIQHLPLENLPGLEKQSFTRHLNLHCLLAQYSAAGSDPTSVLGSGIDKSNAYYVLNPDDNLPSTQQHFEGWFRKEPGWEGVIGRPPTSDEISKNLSVRDLYIYCGHGSGAKYLKGDDLQKLMCRSAVLLVGCSSGRLTSFGQFEPTGILVQYFLANSPCVLAMLWDVTDKDIDRYIEKLLKSWSPRSSRSDRDLLYNAAESRKACSLRHLTGAAPVVYGFPVTLKESKS